MSISISFWNIGKRLVEQRQAERVYEKVRILNGIEPVISDEKNEINEKKVLDLSQYSENYVAWLSIEGTNIDYPIMQNKRDETYYLEHDFFGNPSPSGCLFLDKNCNEKEVDIWLIHGHNMRDGSMFGNLLDYQMESHYEKYKFITISQKSEKAEYQILSAFYTTSDAYDMFPSKGEQVSYLEWVKNCSIYETDVSVEEHMNVLILSTCSYHVDEGRFVVYAVQSSGLNEKG